MGEIITVNFDKLKDRVEEAKWKAKIRFQNTKEWMIKNKDTVITLTPIVVGGVATIVKVVGKNVNLRKEESVKNLYCYDRSLGHYWALRRELSNREWIEIDKRKRNGERLADILSELRVLK